MSALVYWGPNWRANQKEPAQREVMAHQGIVDFFTHTGCLVDADIRRIPRESTGVMPTDEQLLQLASAAGSRFDKVVLIVVRELGPTLSIGIPVIVKGTTEVVLDLRVLDTHTAKNLADVQTHWQNGGTFVIKGTKSLEQDMSAALRDALMPGMDSQ